MAFPKSVNTLHHPEFHHFYHHPQPSLAPSKISLALVGAQVATVTRRRDFEEIEEEEIRQATAADDDVELERIMERLDRIMAGNSNGKAYESSLGSLGSCFGMTKGTCTYGAEGRGKESKICNNYAGHKKSVTTMNVVDPSADSSRRMEIMKLELLAEMAALKGSLLSEIAKSRAREEELRNELAHSRAMTKDLLAKLTQYESASRVQTLPTTNSAANVKNLFANANHLNSRTMVRAGPLRPKRNDVEPRPSSFCSLQNLAREQVIRSVGEKCSGFFKEVQAKNRSGLFRWENALDWLDHHPVILKSLGLRMQDLRLT